MPKFSFQQQVLTGFIITLLFIFSGALTAYNRIQELQNDSHAVDRSQDVIKFTNQVLINIVQAESSVRGLTATGNSYYLDAYNENLSKINPSIDRLSSLIKDNPYQSILVDSLKQHVSQKLYVMSSILWSINAGEFDKAKADLLSDRTINRVQSLIDAIKFKENLDLAENRKVSDANVKETLIVFLIGSGIIIGLFLLMFQFIQQSFKKRKLIEDNLLETNQQLKEISEENKTQNWLLKGSTVIDEAMRGKKQISELCDAIIKNLCIYTNANIGAIYRLNENNNLELESGYAFDPDLYHIEITPGDGLVGQVASSHETFILNNIPPGYLKIKSALGESSPRTILIQPLLFEGELKGVMEIGFLEMPESTAKFIERISHNIAVVMNSVQTRSQVQSLLKNTELLAEVDDC
ncbi:CHASE3 domain-containing protein [Desertivirga arenae]|uniref:CHASE3 domain-containing protein n=1 Tax=Desertivirga arenae TaxID=2810309 RepID=UPI001A956775|nr:CHASE3 domain-containing protein [Pedobacter sp. SYSU D00823]